MLTYDRDSLTWGNVVSGTPVLFAASIEVLFNELLPPREPITSAHLFPFLRQAPGDRERIVPFAGRMRPRCSSAFIVLAFASAGRKTSLSFNCAGPGCWQGNRSQADNPVPGFASKPCSLSVGFGGIVLAFFFGIRLLPILPLIRRGHGTSTSPSY